MLHQKNGPWSNMSHMKQKTNYIFDQNLLPSFIEFIGRILYPHKIRNEDNNLKRASMANQLTEVQEKL